MRRGLTNLFFYHFRGELVSDLSIFMAVSEIKKIDIIFIDVFFIPLACKLTTGGGPGNKIDRLRHEWV